jgi:hypothetical protein
MAVEEKKKRIKIELAPEQNFDKINITATGAEWEKVKRLQFEE